MRILILITGLVLVAGLLARAARPGPDGPLPFGPEQLEFVGDLTVPQKVDLMREILPLLQQLEPRAREMEQSGPARRQELMAEIQGLAQQYTAILQQRLTPEQYARALRVPREPARRAAFLHGLPLEVAAGEPLQRLVAAASDLTPARDERFWTAASLLLSPAQLQQLASRAPLERPGLSPENYLYLPGLTAAQGNRVLARFRGMEAELTDRMAQLQKLQAANSQDLQQMLSLQLEIGGRREQVEAELLPLLSEEQRQALYSIAPGLPASRFYDLAASLLEHPGLNSEQRQQLTLWTRPVQELHGRTQPELERRARAVGTLENEAGMTQMLGVRQLELPIRQAQREAATRLAESLTQKQWREWLNL